VLGASTVIRHNRTKAGEGWLASLIARRPAMVAAVAQANKTARIVWALLVRGGSYDPQLSAAQPAVT
jgi:transposase